MLTPSVSRKGSSLLLEEQEQKYPRLPSESLFRELSLCTVLPDLLISRHGTSGSPVGV